VRQKKEGYPVNLSPNPAPSKVGTSANAWTAQADELAALVSLHEIEGAGLTEADVRDRCPGAVCYTALSGGPCWLREELGPLLGDPDGRDQS
jgi:hypothetical protein